MCKEYCKYHKVLDTIFIIIEVILAVLSILIHIFSDKIKFDAEVSSSIASELIQNFQDSPFENISKVNSLYNGNVNNSLKASIVFFGTWLGTVKGCGTKNETTGKYTIRKDDMTPCLGNSLDSIKPIEFTSYKGMKKKKLLSIIK